MSRQESISMETVQGKTYINIICIFIYICTWLGHCCAACACSFFRGPVPFLARSLSVPERETDSLFIPLYLSSLSLSVSLSPSLFASSSFWWCCFAPLFCFGGAAFFLLLRVVVLSSPAPFGSVFFFLVGNQPHPKEEGKGSTTKRRRRPSSPPHVQRRGGKAAPMKGRRRDHHSTELNSS